MSYEIPKIADPAILARVTESVTKFFQHEMPPADKVTVTQIIPTSRGNIRAFVKLEVFINGVAKTNTSVIKARTDARNYIVPDTVVYL